MSGRFDYGSEPSRYADEDDDDGYTIYESRGTSGGRAGGGGGRVAGGRAGGGGGGSGGGGEDSRTVKHIDANEAKRLQAMIKTEGESEFKNFILYVKDGDGPSNEALDLLNGNVLLKTQTFIQEWSLLRVRPPWLNGVPIIVDKQEGLAHRGSVALEFLRNFHHREAIGQLGRRLGKTRRLHFDTGMAFGNNFMMTSSPWDVAGTPADRASGRVPTFASRDAGGKVKDGDRDVAAWAAKYNLIGDSAKRWQRKR